MFPLRAAPEDAEREGQPLSIVLPHTEAALTEAALRAAVRLALSLNARITLLAIRTLPFPDPLDSVRYFPEFDELIALAQAVGMPAIVHVVYARDWESACNLCLARGSLIVMASRQSWRRTREQRLAALLDRAGHNVTLVTV